MMERLATTPFGGARFTARNFALRAEMERRQDALRTGESGNHTGAADKWQLIRALTEAKDIYGLSDRSVAVLEALTSFHQERELDGKEPIIVFPSNTELSIRSRGMSPATLRRHLAALVNSGLIFRRDSANGKRFCRRDNQGKVEDAFGFDLAPLALRAEEIFSHAEAAREATKHLARVRAEITLHLRDISKIIEAALEEKRGGDWASLVERLQSLSGRVPRNGEIVDLEYRCAALTRLRSEVENTYLDNISEQEISANESCFERHIHNSNTDLPIEIGNEEKKEAPAPDIQSVLERKSVNVSLKDFLDACPQIADYSRGGVNNWNDVLAAADLVRTMLDISPSAWASARKALGDLSAAIVIAAMLERAGEIRSPGGYLRDLAKKAERGRFTVLPMLNALRKGGSSVSRS